MRLTKIIFSVLMASASLVPSFGGITQSRPRVSMADGKLDVAISFTLDSLRLGGNKQIFITPVIEDGKGNREVLPSLLINGRNMHYAYDRGSIRRGGDHNYTVLQEVRRYNGKPQSVDYATTVAYSSWMLAPGASIKVVSDSCGCGHEVGSRVGEDTPLDLNPAPKMTAVYVTPEVTALPVSIHEGRARVQFEVDRTELHAEPYVCRNGQRLDNRAQLRVIDDSISYALSDPNVEIASINICGYASPESPYLHNEELSTGRSRALAEYLAAKYNLPKEKSTYSAVAENWKEFREKTAASSEITEDQRRMLLELIDAPAYGPSDYDAKERTLKTDKRFATLYRSLILPKWFPELRATEFAISTRLKPLDDQSLAKVIRTTPELMTLNQMMRVARLYPEGSDEFNEVIEIARERYPEDVTANLNAAVAALQRGDFDRTEELLKHAGSSNEAENVRGILATRRGDFEAAAAHFEAASALREASDNLKLLQGF